MHLTSGIRILIETDSNISNSSYESSIKQYDVDFSLPVVSVPDSEPKLKTQYSAMNTSNGKQCSNITTNVSCFCGTHEKKRLRSKFDSHTS